jgi:hypothetical protein
MPIPPVESLHEYYPALAQMVAKTSYLPHPTTVQACGGAVFPTVRNNAKRISHIEEEGSLVGMYDDNATPEWAVFWAHGITGKRPKGWTIAHVWPTSRDIACYTHIANLAIIPECFQSLTDKTGPLTQFLRWYAKTAYNWKPTTADEPKKPDGYEQIFCRYLPSFDDPKSFIQQRLSSLKNRRALNLRELMGRTTNS